MITTAFSHPADAATPAVAGFKVITLMPGPNGYPEIDALRAVLSDRTAGFMVTNPEDTGLFNPQMPEMVEAVQRAGGLCAYDQANANGLFGIVRAGDTGFDLCQFNLHKTFSAPSQLTGTGYRRRGASKPIWHASCPGRRSGSTVSATSGITTGPDQRSGRSDGFNGNLQTVLKSYGWVMALGAEGHCARWPRRRS